LETQRTVNPLAPPAILGGCLLLGLVMGGWVVLGSEIKEIKFEGVGGEDREVGYSDLAGEIQGRGE
jgi:hypothetical protein